VQLDRKAAGGNEFSQRGAVIGIVVEYQCDGFHA
jgi:hypothetical protein